MEIRNIFSNNYNECLRFNILVSLLFHDESHCYRNFGVVLFGFSKFKQKLMFSKKIFLANSEFFSDFLNNSVKIILNTAL